MTGTRKVYWRGECFHCGRRQKINKTTGKIGSHRLSKDDSYCPGSHTHAARDTVKEYIAKPKPVVVVEHESPQPERMHAVYKWAIVALLVLVAFTVSYFAGEVITR